MRPCSDKDFMLSVGEGPHWNTIDRQVVVAMTCAAE